MGHEKIRFLNISILILILVIFFLNVLAGCSLTDSGSEQSEDTEDGQIQDDDSDNNDDDDNDDNDWDGYNEYGCDVEHTAWTMGLKLCKPGASPGYTLFAPLPSTTTYLVDQYGRFVHSWQSSYPPGYSAYLLEDGTLLRTASLGAAGSNTFDAGGAGGRVELIGWDSTLLWEYEYSGDLHLQHHDAEMLPGGNVLLIAWELKTEQEVIAEGRNPAFLTQDELWVDHIIEVEPKGRSGGNIVWEWHLWDHLVQQFDQSKNNYGIVADHPELVDINYSRNGIADWTHMNAVDYNPQTDQILLSVLAFCEVWVIDHSTATAQAATHTGGNSGMGGDILYRWGNPITWGAGTTVDQQFYYQHDAHWIEEGLPGQGDILLYNNGTNRPDGNYSTIEQFTPPMSTDGSYDLVVGEPYAPQSTLWTYTATNPKDLYSPTISGAQRLPNGNTLICEGNYGKFFEVTPEGETVWMYINPVVEEGPLTQGEPIPANALGTRNSVFRAYRYPLNYPGLVDKDLAPKGYVELPSEID